MSFVVPFFLNIPDLRFCFGLRLVHANGENRWKQNRKYPGSAATKVAKVGKNRRVFIQVVVLISA